MNKKKCGVIWNKQIIKKRVQVFGLSNWLVGVLIYPVLKCKISALKHLSVCTHRWLHLRCAGGVDCLFAWCRGVHCFLADGQALPWPYFVLAMLCTVHAFPWSCSALVLLYPGHVLLWPAMAMVCPGLPWPWSALAIPYPGHALQLPCSALAIFCPGQALSWPCSVLAMLCPGYALPWPWSVLIMFCPGHNAIYIYIWIYI